VSIKSNRCPLCKGEIPDGVEVCCHCGNHIRRLLEAEARLKELQEKFDQFTVLKPTDLMVGLWRYRFGVWGFYISAIVVSVTDIAGSLVDYFMLALAVMIGIYLGFFRRGMSLWTVILIAFCQPLVSAIAYVLTGSIEWNDIKDMTDVLFKQAIIRGTVAGIGFSSIVLFTGKPQPDQFSLSKAAEWIMNSESKLDRAEKLLLKIGALITAATLVISKVL
jgi:hypothetical protein